ncbi:MAG: hypothetical protein M3O71_26000 [Bacteroidota bacterium]|nr:hypothetical protein [Bacteroidota bacterium]
MKISLLSTLIAILLISWQTKPTQSYAPLTDIDRKNYVLSVDQQEISKPMEFDKGVASSRYGSAFTLKLTNNSNDTLKYIEMWCAWSDILKIDNVKVHLNGNYCSSDHAEMRFVAPHQTTTFLLRITLKKEAVSSNVPFKAGMYIYKYINKQQLKNFKPSDPALKSNTANLIWSDTMIMPKAN